MPTPILTAADLQDMKGKKLGRVLTKLGKTTRERIHEALAVQKTRKVRIGQLLIELSYCVAADIDEGVAAQAGLGYMDLKGFEIPADAREALPAESVQSYQVVPISYSPQGKRLKIAMKSPDNFRAVDDLRLLMGFKVEAVIADTASIDALIKKHFSKTESVTDVVSELAKDERLKNLQLGGKSGESIDLDVLQDAERYRKHADDPEKSEYFVRVKWLHTVPESEAVDEVGLFGNQNTVCQPTTPKWRHTVERLKSQFPRWNSVVT